MGNKKKITFWGLKPSKNERERVKKSVGIPQYI